MRLLTRDDTDHNTTYVTLDEHQEAEAAWSVTYLERDALLRENATLLRQRDELADKAERMAVAALRIYEPNAEVTNKGSENES